MSSSGCPQRFRKLKAGNVYLLAMFSLVLAYLLMATVADGIASTTELVLTPLGTSISSGIKKAELVARHTSQTQKAQWTIQSFLQQYLLLGSQRCALSWSVWD